jgi:S-adenosylmethionine decarboxylase proenzyme
LKYLGTHLLAEFFACQTDKLDDVQFIREEMENAALAANATIVQTAFHRFNPYGVSGVVVIAESHVTIHTWPEYNYAAIDVFTCGDTCDPYAAIAYLKEAFATDTIQVKQLDRGNLDEVERGKRAHHSKSCHLVTTSSEAR